jgi:hypothetical protein
MGPHLGLAWGWHGVGMGYGVDMGLAWGYH